MVCTLQIGALEDLWKLKPEAKVEDLDAAQEAGNGAEGASETQPVVMRYEDAAQYQVRDWWLQGL